MELLPYSLAHLTSEGAAALPTATKLSISTDIISALTYLHSQRPVVLHGDLKPENVMLLTRRGPAKLIDFGSAVRKETFAVSKLAGAKDDSNASGGATMSAHYTAPEFFQKAERTPECDIYALGVLLFELWSGKAAWKGLSLQDICNVVCAGQRPATEEEMVSSLLLPPIIARTIHLCWSADPKARPLSAVLNQIRSIEDPLALRLDQLCLCTWRGRILQQLHPLRRRLATTLVKLLQLLLRFKACQRSNWLTTYRRAGLILLLFVTFRQRDTRVTCS